MLRYQFLPRFGEWNGETHSVWYNMPHWLHFTIAFLRLGILQMQKTWIESAAFNRECTAVLRCFGIGNADSLPCCRQSCKCFLIPFWSKTTLPGWTPLTDAIENAMANSPQLAFPDCIWTSISLRSIVFCSVNKIIYPQTFPVKSFCNLPVGLISCPKWPPPNSPNESYIHTFCWTSLFKERSLLMSHAFAFRLLFPKRKVFADIHRNVSLIRSVMRSLSANCNNTHTHRVKLYCMSASVAMHYIALCSIIIILLQFTIFFSKCYASWCVTCPSFTIYIGTCTVYRLAETSKWCLE